MGSFNVACSASSISIGPGDEIAFFLLLPNNMPSFLSKNENSDWDYLRKQNIHYVGTQSNLIYNNCYFNPLALPIMGEYNDYGGIENIVKDKNTELLEKFFGLPIGAVLDVVTCSRDVYCQLSSGFQHFVKDQSLLKGWSDNYEESFFTKLGLEKKEDGFYYHPDFPTVQVEYGEWEHTWSGGEGSNVRLDKGWKIHKDGNQVGYEYCNDVKGKFLTKFHNVTGRYLNMDADKAKVYSILTKISGMFVLKDIYEAMAFSPVEGYFKEKTVADRPVTPEMLLGFGFTEISKEEQPTTGLNSDFTLFRKGDWDVKKGWRAVDIVHTRHKEYCDLHLSYGCAETLKKKWAQLTNSDPDETFPDPENFKEITDEEKQAIRDMFLELTGYNIHTPNYPKDVVRLICKVSKFAESWEKLTGEKLDISEFEKIDAQVALFNKLGDELREFDEEQESLPKTITVTTLSIEKQREQHAHKVRYSKILNDSDPGEFEPQEEGVEIVIPNPALTDSFSDPLGYFKRDNNEFTRYYKDWKHFTDIYRDGIKEGDQGLAKAFSAQRHFNSQMYSCNRFYFPAMNGEQCGNDEESKNLLLASLEIVNKRLKEREDW